MGACFLHGQNGGSDLNYRVYSGTSTPSSPKENDIWVKSSTPVLAYQFSSFSPTGSNSYEGYVYIVSRTAHPNERVNNSLPALGAIKKKLGQHPCHINLMLAGCVQVIGGVWKNVVAYLYKGGTWVQFSWEWNGELYMEGTWYTANTGDWTALGKNLASDSYTPMAPSVQNETNYFKLYFPSDGSGMFYLAMDLSKYTTLHFEGELNPYRSEQEIRARLNIWSSIGTYTTSNVVAYLAKSGLNNGVGSIDVSSLNGTYYIGFNLYQEYSNILCKKLYLT